jgi:ribulose 1,5-bisphosphate synthetase/thiazole synthase
LVDDGDVIYTIVTSTTSSTDPVFNNITVADVTVTNTNNDVAGILVNPTSGLTTTEAGGQATFTTC